MDKTLTNTFDEGVKMFIDISQEIFVISTIGLMEVGKLTYRYIPWSPVVLYGVYVATKRLIYSLNHLKLLYKIDPALFTPNTIQWTLRFS
jgi:hypothetical protein